MHILLCVLKPLCATGSHQGKAVVCIMLPACIYSIKGHGNCIKVRSVAAFCARRGPRTSLKTAARYPREGGVSFRACAGFSDFSGWQGRSGFFEWIDLMVIRDGKLRTDAASREKMNPHKREKNQTLQRTLIQPTTTTASALPSLLPRRRSRWRCRPARTRSPCGPPAPSPPQSRGSAVPW